MSSPGRLRDQVGKNPAVWILLGLLAMAISVCSSEEEKWTLLCELTGPHDLYTESPITAGEKIDKICLSDQHPKEPNPL
jgi:hypothetical protein